MLNNFYLYARKIVLFFSVNNFVYSRFALSHPHVVELEPGDLLFVPPRWWHFVENLEDSISVNAWFPCVSFLYFNKAY